MGYYERNYSGDNWSPRRYGQPPGGRFADWEVWKKLIAINVAVFLLQILITRPATEEDFRRSPYFSPDMYTEFDEDFYFDDFDEDLPAADADPDEERDSANRTEDTTDTTDKPTSADKPDSTETDDTRRDDTKPDETKPDDPAPGGNTGSKNDTRGKENDRQRRLLERQRRAEKELQEHMSLYLPRVSVVQDWLELDSQKVRRGQVWRLVTAGFCHDRMGIWHLLVNMLFLFWFGQRLERMYGRGEFIAFYVTALIFSSLAYIAIDVYTQNNIPAIGASGAVWGVVALYALMYPYERIFVYFLFPVEIRWLVLVYFAFDLHPVLLALGGDQQFSGVAHAAHVGGAVFGFLYWHQGWRLMPVIDRLFRSR